jgi:hypothetical protein
MLKKVVRVHRNQHKEAGGPSPLNLDIMEMMWQKHAKTQENKHVVRTQNVQ